MHKKFIKHKLNIPHRYISTFTTGFRDVIENNLPKHTDKLKIDLLLDGLILYNTNSDIGQIKKISYLNNTFILLKRFRKHDNQSVNKMLKNVLTDKYIYKTISQYINVPKSFRLIVSRENQFISANKDLIKNIENMLSKNKHLKLNRLLPDIEFWLLIRSEGETFFCMRLTKKLNQEKYLEKGELRPELASILCLISEPQDNDVFMDPFCGHGAIPIQRLFIPNCNYQKIIASDSNSMLISGLRSKLSRLAKKKKIINFSIENFDALNLKSLSNNSIDKIVTDPPWGLRASKIDDIEKFQNSMMHEFHRVLTKDSMVVILAKKEIFDKTLQNNQDKFRLIKEYTTIVSGQKASVYKLQAIK